MLTTVEILGTLRETSGWLLPLLDAEVPAGTPEEIIGDIGERLDLNQHLVRHPDDTFLARAKGDSMIDEKIDSGDLLLVDAAIQPKPGQVVVVIINNEYTVKRLCMVGQRLWLVPGNNNYKAKQITDEVCNVLGVVTYIIKAAR
jgi:DNA polymerase V